jgi:ribosomal protein S18 acetylase RimI-like enzyme
MSVEPIIRLLSKTDVQDYRLIRLATLKSEPDYFGSLYESEVMLPLDAFASVLARDTVFAAYDDQTIIGIARLHGHDASKETHKASIMGVFTKPDYRGQGVGSRLLRTLIDTAKTSFERLVLTVDAENAAAISLYKRLGFNVYGIEPRARKYDGCYRDMVLMVLPFAGV